MVFEFGISYHHGAKGLVPTGKRQGLHHWREGGRSGVKITCPATAQPHTRCRQFKIRQGDGTCRRSEAIFFFGMGNYEDGGVSKYDIDAFFPSSQCSGQMHSGSEFRHVVDHPAHPVRHDSRQSSQFILAPQNQPLSTLRIWCQSRIPLSDRELCKTSR